MKANKRFILYITIVAVCLILAGSVIVKIVFRFQAQNEKLKLENKMYTLQFSTLYTLCGHTDTYDYPKQQAFTSLKEVQNYFPDWDVKRNTDSIHLSRTLKSYCPLHYFAILQDDKIRITYRDGTLKEEIDAAPLSLLPEEKRKLTQGVYLDGKETLNAFLEDFDS